MLHSPEQYKLILDSLSEGVCTVDLQWQITSFNRQAELLTGVTEHEALALTFGELFDCQVCECATLLSSVMTSGKELHEVATQIITRDKQHIAVNLNAAPLRDAQGSLTGLVASFRDNRPLETLRKELYQQFSYEDIISKSPQLQRIFNILPAVAESDSSVLILGPSGTGKELLAKALHRGSPRREHPFVAVNCGALPDTLLESELFGYKKGAFTDARTDKLGRFALAEGGTLFLDEIGDTSPAMQIKLLRVLQERVYEPLGATKTVASNVRIIAATHNDLSSGLSNGTFRSDLYYRINVITFELPPLKERLEDIPLLVAHFIEGFNAAQGRSVKGIAPEAMRYLLRHDYPGNIRELRNIIEHAYVLCRCDEIKAQCLPQHLLQTAANQAHVASTAAAPPGSAISPPKPVRPASPAQEKELIIEALRASKGVKGAAAAQLGIHPTTLWRKMKRYGLKP